MRTVRYPSAVAAALIVPSMIASLLALISSCREPGGPDPVMDPNTTTPKSERPSGPETGGDASIIP